MMTMMMMGLDIAITCTSHNNNPGSSIRLFPFQHNDNDPS